MKTVFVTMINFPDDLFWIGGAYATLKQAKRSFPDIPFEDWEPVPDINGETREKIYLEYHENQESYTGRVLSIEEVDFET